MDHGSDQVKVEAIIGWKAFADKGRQRMAEEEAIMKRYEELHPLRQFVGARQPIPFHFYGPGPDGRFSVHDAHTGTLHFARWKHELAAIEDPNDDGYYDEENLAMRNGLRIRPTYTTTGMQPAKEVNYFRWAMVPAHALQGVNTFPGAGATKVVYEEYLLNEDDFNDPYTKTPGICIDLHNRQDERLADICPRGYKLLKDWSKRSGYKEWEEGLCLGPDAYNPNALKKQLGWFPKRLRRRKAGLGADPQDAVWKDVFHGSLDTEPIHKFFPPKDTWSEDPNKVTTLMNSEDHSKTMHVFSFEALKASLPPPSPNTLEARKAWLAAQAAENAKHKLMRHSNPVVTTSAVIAKLRKVEIAEKLEKTDKREKAELETTETAEKGENINLLNISTDISAEKQCSNDDTTKPDSGIGSISQEAGKAQQIQAYRSKLLGMCVMRTLS
ncbi:hypothetical protein F5Y19DRAFT_408247 [Xylariaceae sp. FL1651]|nr:hypothetical protein F5Y19DRAFT_408247 [Xylariaceae sp. FL1651]